MDFGVARLAGHGQSTGSGVVVGTPNYMSPEQVQGGDIDGRSDLFSVGLILYELATGEKAFKADTVVAVVFKILHEDVDLGLVPAGPRWEKLRQVIRRALAREREERYPDALGMSADLGLALQDLGGSVDPTAPADMALLVRPSLPPPPPPAPAQTSQSSAPTATLRTPRAPSLRPRASSGTPRPPRKPAPPRSRVALGLAWIFSLGAVGLLAFAGWLALSSGPKPWSDPAPAAPTPASPAPTPAPVAPTHEPMPTPPEPSPATTASATPEPTPPPTPEPTPTPVLSPGERLARASDLVDQGRFSQALAEARAVLREDPTNREATVLAQAAEEAVVIEECLANARKALTAGDRDRALAEVRRGLIINPSDGRLLELHGEVTRE